MKIKFITDSGSDIPQNQTEVRVIPLTITFQDESFSDGVNLSHYEFYEKLVNGSVLPSTSQIPPYQYEQVFREELQDADALIVVTVSSRLSGTYQSAMMASQEFAGKVFVIDSLSVTVGQRALIDYGLRLVKEGKSIEEIVSELNEVRKDLKIIAMLDTLDYLKRGGRISATTAFAGTLLSIKPAVTVRDGEVVLLGKARGSKQTNNFLSKAIVESGGIDFSKPFYIGYTGNDMTLLNRYIEDSRQFWQSATDVLPIMSIGGAIGTHVGPGAIALAFFPEKA